MVKVIFLNLLRSKYDIHQIDVLPGTINDIIKQIQMIHPNVLLKDFEHSVIFINSNKIIHNLKFDEIVYDRDEVVFTHFIGGG